MFDKRNWLEGGMAGASLEDIKASADAIEELILDDVRVWSLAFGRTRLVNRLGITMSRLHRLLSSKKPAKPNFDLIYRIHHAFGLEWPYIFTTNLHEAASLDIVSNSFSQERKPPDEKVINLEENRVRERIRQVVEKTGLTKCAEGCGIARATLHSYLESTSLSVSLLWRLHLYTGVPYTTLVTGKFLEEEKALSDSVGSPDDQQGRFPDLFEPIVRLAERHSHDKKSDALQSRLDYLNLLMGRRIPISQFLRLVRILSLFENARGNYDIAADLTRKGWGRLKKEDSGNMLFLLTLHLGIAAHLQVPGLSDEIAEHIRGVTDNKIVLTNVYRVQANEACVKMEMFEAERLARKAALLAYNVTGPLKRNNQAYAEYVLALCAWPLGDYAEALSRIERLLDSPDTPNTAKNAMLALEINIRTWLRDAAGAARAIRQLKKYSAPVAEVKAFRKALDIYQLRLLMLKEEMHEPLSSTEERKRNNLLDKLAKDVEEISDTDARGNLAVSIYLARSDRKPIKSILYKLIRGELSRQDSPIYVLPDLLDAVKKAGLWSGEVEEWKNRVVGKGMLYLDMPRP
ncbi:MAG: hypothetical protein ACYS8W_19185 [Planctomycetota bacterium]|jgi:transcriptional regulator with XRE-family HTH domain